MLLIASCGLFYQGDFIANLKTLIEILISQTGFHAARMFLVSARRCAFASELLRRNVGPSWTRTLSRKSSMISRFVLSTLTKNKYQLNSTRFRCGSGESLGCI